MTEVTAVGLARAYAISDKVLRGYLRQEWPWKRRKNDRWSFPAGSEEARTMEQIAKRLSSR